MEYIVCAIKATYSDPRSCGRLLRLVDTTLFGAMSNCDGARPSTYPADLHATRSGCETCKNIMARARIAAIIFGWRNLGTILV